MILGNKRLTSKEAARVLGVSEASVKRWADGGLLPMERTAGGHRRFRPEDVAVFRRESLRESKALADQDTGGSLSRRRSPRAPRPGRLGINSELAETTFEALVGGRAAEASALLVNLYLHGEGIAGIADAVLCPAMRRVGDLWHMGELTVAEEHVATRAALDALDALRGALDVPAETGLTAICCSTEEDFHELPVRLSALVLDSCGWEVASLGTSTPFYALAEAVGRFRPRLVCVASTLLDNPERAAREYTGLRAAAQRENSAVLLGGAGFAGEGVRRRFPADAYAESFGRLEAFASALARGEHPPPA